MRRDSVNSPEAAISNGGGMVLMVAADSTLNMNAMPAPVISNPGSMRSQPTSRVKRDMSRYPAIMMTVPKMASRRLSRRP